MSDAPVQRNSIVMVGLAMTVLSPVATIVFLVLGSITANPCGMFADGCDAYGTTSGVGKALFMLAFMSAVCFVVGIVVLVVGLADRHADARSSR